MKRSLLIKASGIAIFGATALATAPAIAADTVNMTVEGNIIPSACTPTFEGGGTVDFGTFKTVDLPRNDYKVLGKKDVNLTIRCPAGKRIYFGVKDNQRASSLGEQIADTIGVVTTRDVSSKSNYVFGLGSASIDGKSVSLGSYALSVNKQVSVDGNAMDFRYGWNAGSTFEGAAKSITNDGFIVYSAKTGALPLPTAKTFVFPITVTAAANKGAQLPLSGDVDLNGNATFEVTYW